LIDNAKVGEDYCRVCTEFWDNFRKRYSRSNTFKRKREAILDYFPLLKH